MLEKFCSRSQGQPVSGVRSAAMISNSRAMSREGFIARTYQARSTGATYAKGTAQDWGAIERQRACLGSVPVVARAPRRLEQEPGPFLGLVEPDFDQARGRGIVVVVGQ